MSFSKKTVNRIVRETLEMKYTNAEETWDDMMEKLSKSIGKPIECDDAGNYNVCECDPYHISIRPIVNDIFDVEIDKVSHPDRPMVKGFIGRKKYILIAIIIIAVGLISGFIMSLYSMIFVGLYFIMGYIYSAPPLRLRNYIFGTVFIGLGSSLAYFTGVFSGGEMLNWTQIMIGILILIALSMGTVVKDYKDYEGDKKEGVTNIFTYFGLEKGMKITTVLLIITFLLPFILIYHLIDFIVIIPIALTVVILFNLDRIKRKTQVTMIFFFIEILYVFLRVIGIINFL